jgi:anti-sigma regulatory factor (Ser/Thr protein kinase)
MYHKVFPAELDCLYEMLAFIESFVKSYRISPSVVDQIILATEEALVNVINYGYPDQKKGTVEITCEETSNPAGIKIIIKDQGIPFNPVENVPSTLPPSTTTDKASESLGGYGIYILVGLMDHVEYQRVNEGNILSLTKYL